MGGAPYVIAIYRNAVVIRIASHVQAVTKDPAALRACHELVAGKDPKEAEKAVASAVWEATAPGFFNDPFYVYSNTM